MIPSIIPAFAALICLALIIRIAGARASDTPALPRPSDPPVLAILAALAVLLSSGNIRSAAANGYPDDSLYELSGPQIAIVVLVSFIIGLAACSAALILARRLSGAGGIPQAALRLIVNLVAAVALFWVGYALSPQIYYAYYRTIFSDLPLHYVGRDMGDLSPLVDALTVPPDGHLNDHAAALVLWMMITITIAVHAGQFARDHLYGRVKLAFVVTMSAMIVAAVP